MKLDFSIVIPIRDEATNIGRLIEEIILILKQSVHYEVIIVDDGSLDHSAKEIMTHMENEFNVRLIQHDRSYGQSQALASGIKLAKSEWIITLDGDGQNSPSDIMPIWTKLDHQHPQLFQQVFIGQRIKRQDSLSKSLASIAANFIRAKILSDKTPDTGCGLKLFSRHLFMQLPFFNHMHRFLPALFIRHGGIVSSVPISHRLRQHGQSHYGNLERFWFGIIDVIGVYWLIHRYNPSVQSKEINLSKEIANDND